MPSPRAPAIYAASGAGGGGSLRTAGSQAAEAWLRALGTRAPSHRWHVEIALEPALHRPPTDYDDRTATRFHLSVYAEEWGFFFCHGGRASWIRSTDVPFIHGRDDFALLRELPPLAAIGGLLPPPPQRPQPPVPRPPAAVQKGVARHGAGDPAPPLPPLPPRVS